MSIIKRMSALFAAVILAVSPAVTALVVAPIAHAEEAAAPAAAGTKKVEVENPYGLAALWEQGDVVAKGTLFIMVIMSMATWYVMVTKLFEQYKLGKQAKAAQETFWSSSSVKAGAATLDESSAFRFIADTGITATDHHEGALLEQIDRNTWVAQSIQRATDNVQNRLKDGLSILATVGSTAPFVGLFGTVWGIYHALVKIGMSGQASIDKVAGPVGESLIMTAIGLAVAVPAVLGYNWLVSRNKSAMENVRAFAADLHSVLLGGKQQR